MFSRNGQVCTLTYHVGLSHVQKGEEDENDTGLVVER